MINVPHTANQDVHATLHWCTFEYPSWANLCSPTLDCTANLQLVEQQRSVNALTQKSSSILQITPSKLKIETSAFKIYMGRATKTKG